MTDKSVFEDSLHKWALLVLRVPFGGLLAGHGAQKIFGWFGGHGWRGTRQWLRSLGFHPSRAWTAGAVASELGGGTLTTLGFLHPLGPILTLGSMGMATFRLHWGKPIWVTEGGAELPITNLTIATALLLAGPGEISLDGLFGSKLPRWLAIPGATAALAGVALGALTSWRAQQAASQPAVSQPPQATEATPEREAISA